MCHVIGLRVREIRAWLPRRSGRRHPRHAHSTSDLRVIGWSVGYRLVDGRLLFNHYLLLLAPQRNGPPTLDVDHRHGLLCRAGECSRAVG